MSYNRPGVRSRLWVIIGPSLAVFFGVTALAQNPLSNRVLVVYNANLQSSIDVANYYASKRGIPSSHLLGLRPSSTAGYLDLYPYSKALVEVVSPIKTALTQIGTQQILYIVFTYGTPYSVDNDVWSYPSPASVRGASLDSYVADPFGDFLGGANLGSNNGTTYYANPYSPGKTGTPYAIPGGIDGPVNAIDVNDNPVVVSQPVTYTPFESLASFRARTSKRIYSVFRLDGPNPTIATRQVDKAIQAELAGGLDRMGGKFYFDRKNTDSVLQLPPPSGAWDWDRYAEWMIFRAKLHTIDVGIPWLQESTFRRIGEAASDIPSAPSAAFYSGTYGWYNTLDIYGNSQPDPWAWVPGAIGVEFKSEGMFGGPRGDNNPPRGTDIHVGWSTGAIATGITATLGNIDEPFEEGVPRSDAILRNLFEGANIGDAFFRDAWYVGWQTLNVGDPLYVPFPGGRAPYATGSSANHPPTASITSPANGAAFTAPANITVNSTASDSDGTISKVELFNGSALAGTDTLSPYNFNWNNVAAGSYTLTIKATDNSGAVTTSSPINITVNSGSSQTAFVTGATLGAVRNDFSGWLGMKLTVGASPVNVTALGRYVMSGNSGTHTVKLVNASNGIDVPNGSVSIALSGATAGQFKYVGLANPITLLANTSYYVVSQESPGGDQWADESTLVATSGVASCDGAILNSGSWSFRPPANTTFVPVNLLYGAANQAPAVSITSPLSGATFTAPANFTINLTVSDSDGTINKVELFNGSTLLGTDTVSPYQFSWNTVAAGSYTLTARATDNSGATTTSSPINITVNSSGSQTAFVSTVTLGPLRNDFNGWLGMKFTVGTSPLSVTALGRYVMNGNSGIHTVKLVNASNGTDVPNGLVSIPLSGSTAGQFKYVGLGSPIILSANTSYYVVSQESPGGDQWAVETTTVTTSGAGSCDGAILNSGSWAFRLPANTTFVPVNFLYGANNQAPAVSITSPASGAIFTAPANISINSTAADSDGTISKVELFNGTTLLGTDTLSPYNFSWNNVASGSYTLTAKATDNAGAVTTSSPINITVNAPANQSPAAFVTGATLGVLRNDFNGWLGMKFTVGASPLSVTALGRYVMSGNNGTHTVKLVNASNGTDFPNGSVSIALSASTAGQFKYVALNSPISLSANTSYYVVSQESAGGDQWADESTSVTTSGVASCDGAILNSGMWTFRPPAATTFVPVNFLYAAPNQPPALTITAPVNGSTFAAPANLTVSAAANGGTLSHVDFFANGTLLGIVPAAPYSIPWNNVGPGSYTLTASGTDSSGVVTTSSPVTVRANPITAFVTGIALGPVRNDFTGWLGLKFTVGSTPIKVTALGRFSLSGNARTHTVKLVDANSGTDVLNGSVSISLAGTFVDQFKYGNLAAPITLSAHASYFLVSLESPGGDDWAVETTAVSTTGAASCDGAILSNSSGWSLRPPSGTTFVPVDFKYY